MSVVAAVLHGRYYDIMILHYIRFDSIKGQQSKVNEDGQQLKVSEDGQQWHRNREDNIEVKQKKILKK